MPDFEDDWLAFPHPNGVLEELAVILRERFLPEPCFSGVVPGSAIAIDYVNDECSAMAYGRVAQVFPSTTAFPNADTTKAGPVIQIASVIEVGLFRSASIPDNGEAPSAEEQFEVARLQMADMKAILDAICRYVDKKDLRMALGTYEPIGPDGGVVGGAWTVTIGAS